VNALQDAAILANCLYDMRSTSIEDVKEALDDYREQRFDHVKTQYEASQWNAKLIYGHVRFLIPFHYI
jgi:2-polyprenyl-6-methoxyphenol hydroxylase-like FAD-dependent oxidoreductase